MLVAIFMAFSVSAQLNLGLAWEKNLGGSNDDVATSICATNDGEYFVLGFAESEDVNVVGNHGNSDFWGVKINENGSFFQIPIGGSDYDDGFDVKQTDDGGYILVGTTYSNDGQVSGNHGGMDAWVVKLSSGGSIEWQKCLGGSENDQAKSVLITSEGGYLIGCTTRSSNGDVSVLTGWSDIWLVKLSANGDMEWEKTYGGTAWNNFYSMAITGDDSYIIAGSTNSNDGDVTGNHGSFDQWIIKVDQMGNIEWQKCLGGNDYDEAKDIMLGSDGYYYVLGYVLSNDGDVTDHIGNTDFWLVKLDSDGDIIWTKSFGGTDYDDGKSLCEFNGSIVMAGATNSVNGDVSLHIGGYDYWVIAVNTDGTIIWEMSLGGQLDDHANDIKNNETGLLIAGSSRSSDGHVTANFGGQDFWLAKIEWTESVRDQETENIQVFPNPVKDGNIHLNSLDQTYFELISVSGNVLLSKQLNASNQTIEVSHLPRGIYFARFISQRGTFLEKILIE